MSGTWCKNDLSVSFGVLSRERSVFATQAHVFQIDPQTKKKWLPSSTQAVRVSYYYDPNRKTYRIITMENKEVYMPKIMFTVQWPASVYSCDLTCKSKLMQTIIFYPSFKRSLLTVLLLPT